jgi:hypothetical protein
MDFELTFWLVLGVLGAIFFLKVLATPDDTVSDRTIRRACGERVQ